MVDDAHGLARWAPPAAASSSISAWGSEDVPVLVGTLGKGWHRRRLRRRQRGTDRDADQFAPPTSTPPASVRRPVACATLKSLELLRTGRLAPRPSQPADRRFRASAAEITAYLSLMASPAPSSPTWSATGEQTLKLSALLKERGRLVSAIRPPNRCPLATHGYA